MAAKSVPWTIADTQTSATLTMAPLTAQREIHFNRGDHIHRLAVKKGWDIAPLTNGIERGLHQHRVSGDEAQVFQLSGLTDSRFQADHALNSQLARQRRIDGLCAIQDLARINRADSDSLGWVRFFGSEHGRRTSRARPKPQARNADAIPNAVPHRAEKHR